MDRIVSELGILDQLGPVYWARSSDVSFVGVPGATPARRALLTWHHTIDPSVVTISSNWSQMVSALKAYVEYGINLRKGAYEGLYCAKDNHGTASA